VLAAAADGEGTLDGAWRPFFRAVVDIVDTPWALAVVPDFVFPRTTGERPADLETSLRFGAALARAMARHADIHKLAGEVQHLLRPRSALMAPHVIERVMAEMTASHGPAVDWRAGASVLPRPAQPRGAPGDTTGR